MPDHNTPANDPRAAPAGPARAAGDAVARVAMVGHVDHGKSTLVGRLLHESGSLPEGRVAQIEASCRARGMPFEWAFVTDALQAERDQGVTIDVSHIRLAGAGDRPPAILVDAPGHREFLRNMISGAAGTDAGVLVIDAAEGIRETTRRHGYLLHLLGIGRIAVAVNKMDLVDWSEARFTAIRDELAAWMAELGMRAEHVVPLSARDGDGVAGASPRLAWYRGPPLLDVIGGFRPAPPAADLPLRLPVQDVYRFDERRLIVGRIESGRLAVGDRLLFSPSNKTSRVKSLESWGKGTPPSTAAAGQSVALTLDEQIFIERGEMASHEERPPVETGVFRARLFWLGGGRLTAGQRFTLKLATRTVPVTVQSVDAVIDTDTLESGDGSAGVERNAIADVVLRSRGMLALDEFEENPRTGRFVLVDGWDLVAGGIIGMEGYPDQRAAVTVRSSNVVEVVHKVTSGMRTGHNGHQGGVLWLTGLSGAGKSTLAIELERRLFAEGYQVYVLDGDNVRRGLNANLGFSPEDRSENIRRVGEVAALFADAGFLVISAFISPYRSDRERARAATGEDFHEVWVRASLEACEERDPKGLYRRARAGEIAEFTGVSAPYEPPETAELEVDTEHLTVGESVQAVVEYVRDRFASGAGQ